MAPKAVESVADVAAFSQNDPPLDPPACPHRLGRHTAPLRMTTEAPARESVLLPQVAAYPDAARLIFLDETSTLTTITQGWSQSRRGECERWHQTPEALSDRSGVDVATIRQVEAGTVDPDAFTTQRLADALCVYAQWLRDADIPMVPLSCMTVNEQVRSQTGPGIEGFSGFVIVAPGPWHRDEAGKWRVDPTDGML